MRKILSIATVFLLLCALTSCGGGSSNSSSEEAGNSDNSDSSDAGSSNQNAGSEETGNTDNSGTGSGNSGSEETGNTDNSGAGSGNSGSTVTIPGAPGGLVIDSVTGGTIALSWKAVSGASSYKLYRSTSESGSYSAVTEGISDTSINDTGLDPLTTYYYKITAVNSAGESEASIVVSDTTIASATVSIAFDPALVSTIKSMTVTISGSDISTQTATLSGSAGTTSYSKTFEMSTGGKISCTVLADTADNDTSAALQYYGEALANISSTKKSLTVNMKLHKTRIVVPDCLNSRIVQIDDMLGTNWAEVNIGDQFSTIDLPDNNANYVFYPVEIDFDNAGRMYIANQFYGLFQNYTGNADDLGILRLDTMEATAERAAGYDEDGVLVEDVSRVAIDRELNILYFMIMGDEADNADSLLYKASLSDPDSATPVDLSAFVDDTDYSLYSVCPGGDGSIYLSGEFTIAGEAAQIIHLDVSNPASPGFIGSINIDDSMNRLFDLAIYKESLYATVNASTSYIASMDLDLSESSLLTNSFNFTNSEGDPDKVYMPMIFAGLRPEDLILNDEDPYQRLLSITGISDTEFKTFGDEDDYYPDGIDKFKFFSGC